MSFNFSVTPPETPKAGSDFSPNKPSSQQFDGAKSSRQPQTQKPPSLSPPKDPLVGKSLAEGDAKEAKAEGAAFLRGR
jgi:hypothetical protein